MGHTYRRQLRGRTVNVRPFRAGAFLVFCLLCCLLPTVRVGAQTRLPSHSHDLLRMDPAAFARLLETARPTPLPTDARTVILASLPTQGEVTRLNAPALQKLNAVREILRTAGRDTLFEVRVIDVKQATIGLHARMVLLVTKPAVDLLRAEELQALVAHEMGHEYVWVDYEAASVLGDHERAKELELICDAIAIVILQQLGIDTSWLVAGLEKVARFNRERLGVALNENAYPTLSRRREYARAVDEWATRIGRVNDLNGPRCQRDRRRGTRAHGC